MIRRLKALLRPLAVLLGLRKPLPVANPSPVAVSAPMSPMRRSELSSADADLYGRHAERSVELFLLDPAMIRRQDLAIARAVHAFFSGTQAYRKISLDEIARQVGQFREVYLQSPITRNSGGANFPSGVNLYLMAHCLAPELIVESGVWRGQSSLFLAAACPQAQIHAFDPSLREVLHRSPSVTYHEHDWMGLEIICKPGSRGLCFFDDHQNQAVRILQAQARGFKYVVVDDSWPIEAITGCGWPPMPTVDMIMADSLAPDETVNWVEMGKQWTYVHTKELQDLCAQARRAIRAAYEVPSLYRECGIAPTSAYKFVELT
jgi:hypothetical protein